MKKILVSGAGIAGPAFVHALQQLGPRDVACTVVERATSLRVGGQAVDFRGPVHRAVLERLDLWQPIHARRTTPGELVLLDGSGGAAAVIPAVMMAGDVELLRGDLCALLHERTCDRAEYRFGDHIVALTNRDDGVDVTFASGHAESFDAVVGADGLHSGVRAHAFGPESAFLRHHGYRIASFALPDSLGFHRGALLYSEPGRAASLSATGRRGESRALLVYRGEPMGADRTDVAAQKSAIRETFRGMGWEVSRVLDALDAANDLYVDAITTVHVERYAHQRAVLLGDAAYGGTLGGQGTSLGIVGGYVLAGELARGGTFEDAVAHYEARMRPYASNCQKGAVRAGSFFAPKTRAGLWLRNFAYGVLTTRVMSGVFERIVKESASDFALPEYA